MLSFKEFCDKDFVVIKESSTESTEYTITYDNNPTGAFNRTITVTKEEFDKVKKAYNKHTAQKSGFNKFIVHSNKIELGYNPALELINKEDAKVL